MSRAVILPFPGDPFLLHYWLYYFDNVWSGEIDKLYVHMNSAVENEVVEYVKKLCADRNKVVFIYTDHMLQHGIAINKALDMVTEDKIMLIEDDAFIFKPGMVNYSFEQIESGKYDVVGSKRTSCSPDIVKRTSEVYGVYDNPGDYDNGTNFWPCFFFCQKQLLLKTDRHFQMKTWKNGEVILHLKNYIVDKDMAGDTFVNTSLQLRSMIPNDRILYIRQYHGSAYDIEDAQKEIWLFDGKAPWTHVGSLSSGVGQTIVDGEGRALETRKSSNPTRHILPLDFYCKTDAETFEFERRVQFWLTAFENREQGALTDFEEQYGLGLNRMISSYHLSIDRIRERQKIYREKLGMK